MRDTRIMVYHYLSVRQEEYFSKIAAAACGHLECAVGNVADFLLEIVCDDPQMRRLIDDLVSRKSTEATLATEHCEPTSTSHGYRDE
jgi:hypothetical protein